MYSEGVLTLYVKGYPLFNAVPFLILPLLINHAPELGVLATVLPCCTKHPHHDRTFLFDSILSITLVKLSYKAL